LARSGFRDGCGGPLAQTQLSNAIDDVEQVASGFGLPVVPDLALDDVGRSVFVDAVIAPNTHVVSELAAWEIAARQLRR
jgi:hypothetical protein